MMRRARTGGVTLVELVIYMLIVATLGIVAFLSFAPGPISARYQAERLRTDLRHMQMLALTWGQRLRVTSASGNYFVTCVGSTIGVCATSPSTCGNAITDPATGSAFCVTLESGLALSTAATNFDVDSLGRPVDSAGALLPGNTTYDVTASGQKYTLTVRPITGFVSVSP
jgi:type II secretory pathway pseudopilin PulG